MRPWTQSLLALIVALLLTAGATAHPLPMAQVRVQIDMAQQKYELLVDFDVTAHVMGQQTGHWSGELAAQLAALSEEQLLREVERKRDWFQSQLEVAFDGVRSEAATVAFPDGKTIREAREDRGDETGSEPSTVIVTGPLAAGATNLALRLPREVGAVLLVVRRDAVDLPPQLLAAGQLSQPMPLTDAAPMPSNAAQFVVLGFTHIIPQGLDHILFVLGLFLLSPTLKPLLWQVTAFTLAHSLTLAMAMNGIVRLPAGIVEPVIAASIAFIAVENLFTSKLHPWRLLIVFAFGLIHGLGFAGVLSEFALPAGQLMPAVLAFNVGVEAGQLAVIGLAFLAVGWLRKSRSYRKVVIVPGSLAIAAVGIYWTIVRTFAG